MPFPRAVRASQQTLAAVARRRYEGQIARGGGYTQTLYDNQGSAYLTNGAPGLSDGPGFTMSIWLNLQADDATRLLISEISSVAFRLRRETDNKFELWCQNNDSPSGNAINRIEPPSTTTSSSGLTHLLVSCDRTENAGLGSAIIVIDDSVELNTTWDIATFDLKFATGTFKIFGADSVPDLHFGDLWWDDSYLNISVESNRRYFIDGSGNPVDLGDDGTGSGLAQPWLFIGGSTTAANINAGAGNTGSGPAFTATNSFTDVPA